MGHDLDSTTQLDAEALDEGLVGEEEEGSAVDLLLSKDVTEILAVWRRSEVIHDIVHAPRTNIGRQFCIIEKRGGLKHGTQSSLLTTIT